MTATDVLRLEHVHAFIGSSHVLDDVSFSVPQHQVTTILGRNGAGKTSTLKAILGLVERRGSITLAGREVSGDHTHRIAASGIGYIPEDREVFHGLTVAENLRLAERDKPNYDRVHELFPELKSRRDQLAGTMSGGQQQMLSVGRALLNDNQLLLIDEPTKGLAPRLVTEFVENLERIVSETTVLLVEQNLGVARRLADRILVLEEGRVVRQGEAAQMLADDGALRRMLGVDTTHDLHEEPTP